MIPERKPIKLNDLCPRIDHNLVKFSGDFIASFGVEFGDYIEDISLYMQIKYLTAEDFYGGVKLCVYEFCDWFGYKPSNLLKKVKGLGSPGMKMIDGKPHDLETVWEHCLWLMGKNTLVFSGSAKINSGAEMQKIEFIQLIKTFYIKKNVVKNYTKTDRKYTTRQYYAVPSDEMIRNVASFYLKGYRLETLSKMSKSLRRFYFQLLKVRALCPNAKKNSIPTEANTLFKYANVKYKRQRQSKYRVNKKFDDIVKITGDKWYLKWEGDGWEPLLDFCDIVDLSPEEKRKEGMLVMDQYLKHQLQTEYNKRFENIIDRPGVSAWVKDEGADRSLKVKAYQTAHEIVFNKHVDHNDPKLCAKLRKLAA